MGRILGLIEGFYGRSWHPQRRKSTIAALQQYGYSFYIYAPKSDAYLRRRWREPYPEQLWSNLLDLARFCRSMGVKFGVGFSPYELFRSFDRGARADLATKLDQLRELDLDLFAILFDDMPGGTPQLAESQLAVVEAVAQHLSGVKLVFCPTYYSDDPVLDRVFGRRPPDYLATLGRGLDQSISIFWTGPEVCSRELTPGHLERVATALQRLPWLWDNYPVNDGPRMSQHLHVRSVTGRSMASLTYLEAHAVNPALQPTLTQIPAITLAMAYQQGLHYDYGRAFLEAATEVCGSQLAQCLVEDLEYLQDRGLDRLNAIELAQLRARYGSFDHEAAREVIAFINGEYHFEGPMN